MPIHDASNARKERRAQLAAPSAVPVLCLILCFCDTFGFWAGFCLRLQRGDMIRKFLVFSSTLRRSITDKKRNTSLPAPHFNIQPPPKQPWIMLFLLDLSALAGLLHGNRRWHLSFFVFFLAFGNIQGGLESEPHKHHSSDWNKTGSGGGRGKKRKTIMAGLLAQHYLLPDLPLPYIDTTQTRSAANIFPLSNLNTTNSDDHGWVGGRQATHTSKRPAWFACKISHSTAQSWAVSLVCND